MEGEVPSVKLFFAAFASVAYIQSTVYGFCCGALHLRDHPLVVSNRLTPLLADHADAALHNKTHTVDSM